MPDYISHEEEYEDLDPESFQQECDLELEARLRTDPGAPARTQEEIDEIIKDYYRARREALDRLYGEIGL